VCISCGTCMIGCRHNAKNTLVKNYLWLAERRGVRVHPLRKVIDVKPIDAADGSQGYVVTHQPPGSWIPRDRHMLTARGVVFAAGALGTNHLLARCRSKGSLPRLSNRVGQLVRTNSEALLAVTADDPNIDFTQRVAITSSIYPDAHTHIETVTYGGGGGAMSLLFTLLTAEGTRFTRPLLFLREAFKDPRRYLRTLFPSNWSRRTLILLVMQTLDNSISLVPKRRPFGRGDVFLSTRQDPDNPNPTYIKAANDAAELLAGRLGGTAQSSVPEALANIPSTAHILGGAVIGADEHSGVIDHRHRIFGYENLLVCDGAAVPANPGVNPSLTITALAENAMSHIPDNPAAPHLPPKVDVAPAPVHVASA